MTLPEAALRPDARIALRRFAGYDGTRWYVDDVRLVARSADCNENGTPDECEIASGGDCNGNGVLDVCEGGLGDANCDGTVDLTDLAALASCLIGPSATALPPTCAVFEYAVSGAIDLRDVAGFMNAFTGR